jgi:hypothetical protein
MWVSRSVRAVTRYTRLFVALLLVPAFPSLAGAATFWVTSTVDAGPGSLREQVMAANTAAGLDTIGFAIPGAGPHIIALMNPLPDVWDTVVVDGYTQPGASPATAVAPATLMVQLDGGLLGFNSNGLVLEWGASGTVIRGLSVTGFGVAGIVIVTARDCIIEGDYIGTDVTGTSPAGALYGVQVFGGADNTIGGVTPEARNVVSGNVEYGVVLYLLAATGNTVLGNFIGTNASGDGPLGNGYDGVYVLESSGNTIGGAADGARNVISGNGQHGVTLASSGNSVFGNYIGTDAAGTSPLGNGGDGICLWDAAASNTVIGGSEPGEGNLISANGGNGILIGAQGEASGNQVAGNYVGTDVSGSSDLGNSGHGIEVWGNDNMIGMTPWPTVPNIIAYNAGDGVHVVSGTGNSILSNRIYSNGGLGIDLGTNGVTPNDSCDVDTGPNNLQNFPIITYAETVAGETEIHLTLNSTPYTTFRIEFFYNTTADPSAHGEGEFYFWAAQVGTGPFGNSYTIFSSFPGPVSMPVGSFASCTATGPDGSTSEFGPVQTVVPVELASFIAEPLDGAVKLTWTTLSECDNVGFHIHRSAQGASSFMQVTDRLIPGAGTSSEPHSYSYVDRSVLAGNTYWYRLADVDLWGNETLHGPISVLVTPAEFALTAPSPNPFSAVAAMRLSLAGDGQVSVRIYNVAGDLVRVLHDGPTGPGVHDVLWDGRDDLGRKLPPGAYTVAALAGGARQSRRVVLAR